MRLRKLEARSTFYLSVQEAIYIKTLKQHVGRRNSSTLIASFT